MNYDPLETCPYDPVHRILRSRMQFHLTKCAKNFPDSEKKQCPFDTRHRVNEVEFKYHIDHCPSRESVVHFKLRDVEAEKQVNLVPIITEVLAVSDENWDDDIHVKTYKPLQHIEDRTVMWAAAGLTKTQRKAHRRRERERFNKLNAQEPIRYEKKDDKKKTVRPRENPREPIESKDETAELSDEEYKPLRRPKKIDRNNPNASMNDTFADSSINESISFNQSVVIKDSNENLSDGHSTSISEPASSSAPSSYATALSKSSTKPVKSEKTNVLNNSLNKTADTFDKLEDLSTKMKNFALNDEINQKKSKLLNKQIEMMHNASLENVPMKAKNSRCAAYFKNFQ